jgi:hypothetical protein
LCNQQKKLAIKGCCLIWINYLSSTLLTSMKEKKLAGLLLSFFILCLLFLPAGLSAQPGGPGGNGDPGCDPLNNTDDPGLVCPIDSYVYVLLGIGVLYGAWKVKERKEVVEE